MVHGGVLAGDLMITTGKDWYKFIDDDDDDDDDDGFTQFPQ